MFRLIFVIIVVLSCLTACGGGGGGGGGGGSSGGGGGSGGGGSSGGGGVVWNNSVTEEEANVYRTNEYKKFLSGSNRDQSLEKIHAAQAYALLDKNDKVVAGDGVKIAIVDTGAQANHIEISANLSATDNYNYYQGNNNINDQNGHGTNVASIAAGVKDGNGMHGVAYDATLVISNTYCCTSFGNTSLGNVSEAVIASSAISGVKVINASFGGNLDQGDIDAVAATRNHDVLFVAAAGNSQGDNPDAPASLAETSEGYVLAVGAVDSNSTIASFSNKCGTAMAYCLVAPGVSIVGANIGNSYSFSSGTSQATPHVSGAAAVLRAAWPHLSAAQTSNILLTTATDLGTAGVDSTYGHGLLNLYGAVQAQGSNNFSYGASVNDSHYDLRQSSIAVDPIFGDAFALNVGSALKNAVFFDDYGRDYKANLDKRIAAKGSSAIISDLNGILLNNYKTNNIPFSFSAKNSEGIFTQMRFQVRSYASEMASRFSNLDRSVSDKTLTAYNGFSIAQNLNHNNRFSFAFNIDELTNTNQNNFNNAGFLSAGSIAANPYQSFMGGVSQNLQVAQPTQKNFNQLFFEHKLFQQKIRLNASYQASYQGSSILVGNGIKQNQIMDVNFAYNPNEKTNLMLSLGNLNEFNNNFLNSQAVGAFESGGDAKTSYAKIMLHRELFKNFSVMMNYSEGITRAAGNNLGIFRDYQDVRSRSSAAGFIFENFFGGKFGFLYSEPLRVYSGKAVIDVPIARDNAGNVTRYVADVSLRPHGKQQSFEMVYGRNLGQDSWLNFNFMISKDIANIKGRDGHLGLMNYRLKF